MMAYQSSTLGDLSADALLRLFESAADATAVAWDPSDYGPIWRHQLKAPWLAIDPQLDSSAERGDLHTLTDLLREPHPPLPLMQMMTQYAKQCVEGHREDMPEEVARVLYFVLIQVSRLRSVGEVSRLDAEGLDAGLRWAAQRPWLDEAGRSMVEALRDGRDFAIAT